MKRFVYATVLLLAGCEVGNSDVDKILKAKEIVRSNTNYPNTLSFHEFDTSVNGNVVTLKFTCKNGFGVPETYTRQVKVD